MPQMLPPARCWRECSTGLVYAAAVAGPSEHAWSACQHAPNVVYQQDNSGLFPGRHTRYWGLKRRHRRTNPDQPLGLEWAHRHGRRGAQPHPCQDLSPVPQCRQAQRYQLSWPYTSWGNLHTTPFSRLGRESAPATRRDNHDEDHAEVQSLDSRSPLSTGSVTSPELPASLYN